MLVGDIQTMGSYSLSLSGKEGSHNILTGCTVHRFTHRVTLFTQVAREKINESGVREVSADLYTVCSLVSRVSKES